MLIMKEKGVALTDEQLTADFTQEKVARYRQEARERSDPALVKESERRIRKLSKAQWEGLKREGEEVTRLIAGLMDKPPDNPEIQILVGRHHAWIEHFYPCSAERYRGLGQLYAEHAEFRAFYEKHRPGLADFMSAAMNHYAEQVLDKRE